MDETDTVRAGLERVKAAAGDGAALARALGINKSAVWRWKQVPVERVAQIEKLYGVPRRVQRPDIFQRESDDGETDRPAFSARWNEAAG